jgi:hypothetical protein
MSAWTVPNEPKHVLLLLSFSAAQQYPRWSGSPLMTTAEWSGQQQMAWGLISSRRVTRSLIRFVRISKVEAHRHAAISALGSIGDSRAERCLLSILLNRNESEAMRQWAAEALKGVRRRGHRVTTFLIQALGDPSASVRWSVLSTLGCIGDRSAVAARGRSRRGWATQAKPPCATIANQQFAAQGGRHSACRDFYHGLLD